MYGMTTGQSKLDPAAASNELQWDEGRHRYWAQSGRIAPKERTTLGRTGGEQIHLLVIQSV
jgi:hypothetical protein